MQVSKNLCGYKAHHDKFSILSLMVSGTGYALVINGHSLAFALQEDMEELLFETASKVSRFTFSLFACMNVLLHPHVLVQ